MRRTGILLAAALGLAAGCGGGDGGGQLPPEGSSEELLTYSRAGGFAPSIYEVRIDADGRAVVSYGDIPEQLEEEVVQLSDEELARLRTVLAENPISGFPAPDPDGICADCFSYELAYGGGLYAFDDATPNSDRVDAVRDAIHALPLPQDDPSGYS
jgi:hypothetical protein